MFFILILSSFLALASYVYARGYQALPPSAIIKIIYSLIYIAGFLAFILRMYYGDKIEERYAVVLSNIGFTFIIAFVYFAIIAFGIDLIRIANHFLHVFPDIIIRNWAITKQVVLGVSVLSVLILLIIGRHNFNNPEVTKYELTTEKQLPGGKLRIVLVSDIHLSFHINVNNLKRYVDLINEQNGDVVLLAGDIADRDIRPLVEQKMDLELARINAPMGVFSITGNHEYYGGTKDEIYQLIKSAGITMLIDSAYISPHGFAIVGRDDLTNHRRAPLDSIMKYIGNETPVILLDHQPKKLNDAVKNRVDLQLSGHTHQGQFWPGSLVTAAMFDLAYGHRKIGNTDFIVTSGLGLWGPKYRIGTKSEVVVIEWKQLPASAGSATTKSSTTESSETTSTESSSTGTATSSTRHQ